MTFSEFAKLLYPYCGNGENPSNFLVALFSNATKNDAHAVFDKKPEYLKRIYEGQKAVTQEDASYILTNLEKGKLDTYLFDLLSDDALTELCRLLQPHVGAATNDDITAKIATLFVFILEKIASDISLVSSTAPPIEIRLDGLYLNGEKVKLPDKLVPPDTPEDHEAVYIAELLLAYAEAEGADISRDAIPHKYLSNYNQQRQNYFNALAVRRRVRDVFPSEVDEFDALKTETYDGIIDVHSGEFEHGFARLCAVLSQASIITIQQSLLGTQLKWVSNSVKKGVCHILVDEGKIRWVVNE